MWEKIQANRIKKIKKRGILEKSKWKVKSWEGALEDKWKYSELSEENEFKG